MGCCVSKGYSYEVDLFDQDLLTLEDLNLIKIDEDFKDISLELNHGEQLTGSHKQNFLETQALSTQSSSQFIYKIDIESAFLQASDYSRRKTLQSFENF